MKIKLNGSSNFGIDVEVLIDKDDLFNMLRISADENSSEENLVVHYQNGGNDVDVFFVKNKEGE